MFDSRSNFHDFFRKSIWDFYKYECYSWKSDFLREIWEFRESNENTLVRNFYWKLFFQFLSKFSFNLRKKLSSFGRRFLFVYWSNSKMTGRNSNPTIERKTVDFRLSLPISLKIPIHFSNSLFRAVEKGHVAITHMKAGVALLRARQRELKSFGRSLPCLSLGTHHQQHFPTP